MDSLYLQRGLFMTLLFMNILFSYVRANEIELRRLLFHKRNYDPYVCPEIGITKVHTNLILLQIESVNEKAQVVTSNIQLTCAWCDPNMSWNVTRFNISELSVSSGYLWTPDVVVVNSADGKYSQNRENYALILRHDGYVRFMFQDLWKTICKVRSTYFPFDQQHCTIIIRSGSRDSNSIKFIQRRPIQGRSFIRGEWELIHSYTQITNERISDFGQDNYSLVRFSLILKRNYIYYLIKIILPFTLVSFVTLFTFLLPPQSGEKLTLSVTILLSLVIYLQLVTEYIPKSDDEIPILTLFCNANFFLVFLSCIMTVYVLYLYNRPTTSHIESVPLCLKIVILDYLKSFVYCNINKRKTRQNTLKSRPNKAPSPPQPPRRLSSIEKNVCNLVSTTPLPTEAANQKATEILKCLKELKAYIRTQWLIPLCLQNENDSENDALTIQNQQRLHEWQEIALVLDRLFFLLFIIAMPCTSLLFLSAHLSIANDFRSNLTNTKLYTADAKCDLIYNPRIS